MSEIVKLDQISGMLKSYKDQGVKQVTFQIPAGTQTKVRSLELCGYRLGTYTETSQNYATVTFTL